MKKRKGFVKTKTGQMWMLIGLFLLLVIFMVFAQGQIPQRYDGPQLQNGVDLLFSIANNSTGMGMLVEDMIFYVLLPFMIIWTLLWGIFEQTGDRFFSRNISFTLSILLAFGVMFTGFFLAIASTVIHVGAIGGVLLGLYLVFLLYTEVFSKQSKKSRAAIQEYGKDQEMIDQEEEINDRLRELHKDVEKSDTNINTRIEAALDPTIKAGLNDIKHLEDMAKQAEQALTKHSSKLADKIVTMIKRKRDLAKRWRKHQEDELADENRY